MSTLPPVLCIEITTDQPLTKIKLEMNYPNQSLLTDNQVLRKNESELNQIKFRLEGLEEKATNGYRVNESEFLPSPYSNDGTANCNFQDNLLDQ